MRLQDLEPVSARLCLSIEKICRERFDLLPDRKLLLAISGGADSVSLALIFHILAPRLKASLFALHVNHGLRPEAKGDAEFVANLCSTLSIPLKIVNLDIHACAKTRRCGLEEAGHIERRLALLEEQKSLKADYILTAHHAGDLAEDILMRITRGSGWPGLGGMAWQIGPLLRPLLGVNPQELRAFLITCGQSWREDESNQSLNFKRNRFRHVILPLLECENPNILSGLGRVHDLAEVDAAYWDNELSKALSKNPWHYKYARPEQQLFLPVELLKPMHSALRLRLFHRALNVLRGSGQTRSDALLRLDNAFKNGTGGKIIQCSGGITAQISKAGVTFTSRYIDE